MSINKLNEPNISGKERMSVALSGGKPDRVPVFAIYDNSYLSTCMSKDPRLFFTASSKERDLLIEESFLRHELDGFFVWEGTSDEWSNCHEIEKKSGYWLVTDVRDGIKKRLLPNCTWLNEDGSAASKCDIFAGEPRIKNENDIYKFISKPYLGNENELKHWFSPIKHLSSKYNDHHFSFHIPTPMAESIDVCGGYVEGLMMLASDIKLFRKILRASLDRQISRLKPGKESGGNSILFTSYYTGADTISPQIYSEEIFPIERELCEEAKSLGLYVMNWYLGDLMPMLDKVMQLPIDALVLEQGRKGYDIDLGTIRKKVGQKCCLFGYCYESDLVEFNKDNIAVTFEKQFNEAGLEGAFVAGTPIVPTNAAPEAVEYYINQVKLKGQY